MNILLIQHRNFINGSGGTEKMCCILANEFVARGHHAIIATNENTSGEAMFPLQESIHIHNIYDESIVQKKARELYNYTGKNPLKWLKFKLKKKIDKATNRKLYKEVGGKDGLVRFNLRQRAMAWKKYIDQINPDVIITMSIDSVLEITYGNTFTIPIVDSCNGRPDHDFTDVLWYRSPDDMDRLEKCFESLAGIQILFESYKVFLPKSFNGICSVIPNPAPQLPQDKSVNHLLKKERYQIVSIASLVLSHKQQDLSIEAFSTVALKYPQWDMVFWGVGRDLEKIQNMILEKNLQDRIFLKGFTENAIEELQQGDIFIFPSRHEGFPLALVEAMGVGLPCVGLRSCCGVNELIIDHYNGFLADNVTDISSFLDLLMGDSQLRQTLGQNGYKDIKQYNLTRIMDKWERLLHSTTHIS